MTRRDTPLGDSCQHQKCTPHYTHIRCDDCGWIITDSSGWGIAARKWFPSLGAAEFYREHGRLPE